MGLGKKTTDLNNSGFSFSGRMNKRTVIAIVVILLGSAGGIGGVSWLNGGQAQIPIMVAEIQEHVDCNTTDIAAMQMTQETITKDLGGFEKQMDHVRNTLTELSVQAARTETKIDILLENSGN